MENLKLLHCTMPEKNLNILTDSGSMQWNARLSLIKDMNILLTKKKDMNILSRFSFCSSEVEIIQ